MPTDRVAQQRAAAADAAHRARSVGWRGSPPRAWEVLRSRQGTRENGNGAFSCCCPAHDDHNPSLSVKLADDGACLVHCHAGCDSLDVLRAVGLTARDLYPDESLTSKHIAEPRKAIRGLSHTVASYRYEDGADKLVFTVDRIEGGGKPKSFSVRPKGVPPEDRPLYRLPELEAGDDPVVVCEGEKCADSLADIGVTATTCAFGSGAWLPHYSETLRGREVVVWPDADEPGRKHAEAVLSSLVDIAASLRCIEPPDWLPEGGDACDVLVFQLA